MQYGVDLKSYVRVKEERKNNISQKAKENYLGLLFLLVMGFLLSRVNIPVNFTIIKTIAPFGVAYMLVFNKRNNNKEIIMALTGVIAGYITLGNLSENVVIYIALSLMAMGLNYVPMKMKRVELTLIKFIVFFAFIMGYNFLILNKDIVWNLSVTSMNVVFIIPAYFLMNYSMECISEINNNHYFTSEEIISIELLLSLLIVGIGSISIFNIYVRGIFSVVVLLLFSYIVRGNNGSVIGIILGILLGVTTKNFAFAVAVYGISTLVASIFKEGGKILTILAFSVSFLIITYYGGTITKYTFYELGLGAVIFLLLPKKFINKIEVEFDEEKKQEDFNEFHFKKMKDELALRLGNFADVLTTMSVTLNTIVENEELVNKNKGEALINNLADRVCADCDFKKVCWKREMHETYTAFAELIENCEEGRAIFPICLEKNV